MALLSCGCGFDGGGATFSLDFRRTANKDKRRHGNRQYLTNLHPPAAHKNHCGKCQLFGDNPSLPRPVAVFMTSYQLLFGIAFGYADAKNPANCCRTTRAPLARAVTFVN